jgi:hypothetical protein
MVLSGQEDTMNIVKLKTKNQVTIPQELVKRMHLKADALFKIDIEGNYIKLLPVEVEPLYTKEECAAIDNICVCEKPKARVVKSGKEFSKYIKSITK